MPLRPQIAILGAGPAGLGAAYQLSRRGGFDVTVVERGNRVGGNAGSFDFGGLSVDYGSHRLHPSCAPEIMTDIRAMLGEDLLDRPRHGRIRLRGRWVHFPLKPADLAFHLPPGFLFGAASDAVTKPFRKGNGDSFASVLEHGLGRTICRDFYFPYARKIWGCEPNTMDAEQAHRRVSAGSATKIVRKVLNAVPGFKKKGAGRFFYPRNGFGAISESYASAAAAQGAHLRLQTSVAAIEMEGGRVSGVRMEGSEGVEVLRTQQVLSSIPISQLVRLIQPMAPARVLEGSTALKFRSMILIYLQLATEQFTEFDAHYFPDREIGISRLSEPKNYGLKQLPGRTVLCAELPCSTQDVVWSATNEQLGRVVTDALATAGVPVRCAVEKVESRRLAQAYPIYHRDFRAHFEAMDGWLESIDGIVTFGRQGLFAHDNTHHALAMAYALNGCIRDDGSLDRGQWTSSRENFRSHVVED